MSRCLLCVHVWLENACERGVAVRLGSWSGVTMARTPFLVPVPCIACYIVVDCTFLRCIDWTWYPKTFVVATLQIPDLSLPLPAYRQYDQPRPPAADGTYLVRKMYTWTNSGFPGFVTWQIPDLSQVLCTFFEPDIFHPPARRGARGGADMSIGGQCVRRCP